MKHGLKLCLIFGFSIMSLSLSIPVIAQGDFDLGIDGDDVSDLLEKIAYVFYKGDGTGVLEIIWNIIFDDIAVFGLAIFLLFFAGGAYQMLKKQGQI